MKLLRGLWVMVAALVVSAGCVAPNDAVDEIRIGVILPLSGAYASYGKALLGGAELAARRINRDGGVDGRLVRLLVEDDRSTADGAEVAVDKLIDIDAVSAVIGGYATDAAQRMVAKCEASQIPCILLQATNTELTENTECTFRAGFDDAIQARALAQFMRNDRLLKNIGVLLDLDEDATYSRALALETAQEFHNRGGGKPYIAGYHKNAGSRLDAIKQCMDFRAEAIFLPSYPSEARSFIIQARKAGFNGLIVGADGFAGDYGDIAELGDCVFTVMYTPQSNYPSSQKFDGLVSGEFNRKAGNGEAVGYDALTLLLSAFSERYTPDSVIRALKKVKSFPSVRGRISSGNNGELLYPVYIMRLTPNGATLLETYDSARLSGRVLRR